MVDQDLQTASSELAGEFQQLDLASIALSVAGIGTGLFTAEFAAEFFGNLLTESSGRTRTAVEVMAKFGMGGVHLLARRFFGGPTMGVLLALGAVGAVTSGFLQIIETFVAVLQTGDVSQAAPSPTPSPSVSDSAASQPTPSEPNVTADTASVGSSPKYSV